MAKEVKGLEGLERPAKKRKGSVLAAICNILGTMILIMAIASSLPIVIPQLMGYELYNVVSGSMEPEIPIGSVLYVKSAPPEDIAENEVIAFHSGDGIISHRVMENHVVEGEFITKGDANAGEDMNAVPYSALVGRVERHIPMMGALMEIHTSTAGKIYVVMFAACGAMLNILAGRLRQRRARK